MLNRGVTTLLVILFMGVFMLIMGAISSYALELARYGRGLYYREQAFRVAEAGLQYYRWKLAHNQPAVDNGSFVPATETYTVMDPQDESKIIGTAEIVPTVTKQCGQIQWIDIVSKGVSNANPNYSRKVTVRYMRPSVAAYSYVLNSNVWAGADRQITGSYFSNGGIRMDGTNNSLVLTPVNTWNCTSSFGCNPGNSSANGIVGNGSGSAFWRYGSNKVPIINFSNITNGLSSITSNLVSNGGLHIPASGSPSPLGYHVILRSDGNIDIRRVTSVTNVPGMSDNNSYGSDGWMTDAGKVIANQEAVTTYSLNNTCNVLWVESNVWLEGNTSKKLTIISYTPSGSAGPSSPNIYLANNVGYTVSDGTVGLTVIAERDVVVNIDSANNLMLQGNFVALGGEYARRFFTSNSGYGTWAVSSAWAPYVLRQNLTIRGTTVSSLRTGTKWGTVSGYQSRIDAYDYLQALAPPPFTPSATTTYKFVSWRVE